jgi:hypothetical protein
LKQCEVLFYEKSKCYYIQTFLSNTKLYLSIYLNNLLTLQFNLELENEFVLEYEGATEILYLTKPFDTVGKCSTHHTSTCVAQCGVYRRGRDVH